MWIWFTASYPLIQICATASTIPVCRLRDFILNFALFVTENGFIGRLKIARFADNQKLLKSAGVLFDNVEGNAVMFGSENIRIAQGMVEASNVNAIAEMTNLVKIQRSYDYVQQMIDEEHDRLSNTISTFAELA